MKKKLNDLIKILEHDLKSISNTYARYCMYSIYEDLLLLTWVTQEDKKEELYRHINMYVTKLFGSKSKYVLPEKEEYTDSDYYQILLNVEKASKKVF